MRLVFWKAVLGLGSGYREGTLVQLLTLEAAKWKEYAASCLCVGMEDTHFWRLDLIPIMGLRWVLVRGVVEGIHTLCRALEKNAL